MKMTTCNVAILLLATLFFPPQASAANPVLTCSADILPTATYPSGLSFGNIDSISATGNIAITHYAARSGHNAIDTLQTAYTTGCNPLWNQACLAADNAACLRTSLHYGPSQQLTAMVFIRNAPTGGTLLFANYQKLSANHGLLVNGFSQYDAKPNAPDPTAANVLPAVDAYALGGKEYGLIADGGNLYTYNDTAHTATMPCASCGVMTTESGSNPYAYINTAGTGVAKVDLVSHAILSTLSYSGINRYAIDGREPARGQGSLSGSLFTLHNAGSASTLCYDRIDKTTFTKTVNCQGLSGFWGTTPSTQPIQDYDIDGNNNFLICGSTGPFDVMNLGVWIGNTTTNTLTQLIGIPTPFGGGHYVGNYCGFDYHGGFWVEGMACGTGTDCMRLLHFTLGTIFTDPTPPPIDPTIYPNPDGTPTSTTGATSLISAGGGLVSFAASIGFTTPADRFFFGLLLLAAICILVFAILASFLKNEHGTIPSAGTLACGVITGYVGIGVILLDTILGFWTVITAVLIGILAAAILAGATRELVVG